MAEKSKAKITKINDVDSALAVIAHEAARCFCGKEGPLAAQPKSAKSCTGGVFWGMAGETWPVAEDGTPLIPWLQIISAEVEGAYGVFHIRKSVCFYIRKDFSETYAKSTSDRSDFVVREYPSDSKLVPLKRPKELAGHPFRRVTWTKQEDYPCLSKYHQLFDDAVYKQLCDRRNLKFENRSGIKIGGWPTPVQQRQQYPGSCTLQIDITENFHYADSGVGYFTRAGDYWYLEFECC